MAPGSRSGPLTVAVALSRTTQKFMHIDERALGFYALGQAKASGQPAVIITTSGSAVANLMPAVVEASLDHVPLIILSADRPAELYDTSANQTLDQVKFFGSHVRWFFDIPSPNSEVPLAMLLTTVDQAYQQATIPLNRGPVHLNCHFPQPLLPEPDFVLNPNQLTTEIQTWYKNTTPYTRIAKTISSNSDVEYRQIAQVLSKTARGLIVLGKLDKPLPELTTFIGKLSWPVFPDITSQYKQEGLSPHVITQYDLLLLSPQLSQQFKPEIILHIGERINSKRLGEYLSQLEVPYIKVQDTLARDDEFHKVTQRFTSISYFCEKLTPLILQAPNNVVVTKLAVLSTKISQEIELFAQRSLADSSFNEPSIAYQLSQMVPATHTFFIGNSMPIRNMQMYSNQRTPAPQVYVNRGASGIDGLLATACGCAAGSDNPTTAMLGDLSALHDLNSLMLLAKSKVPIILVIINNDGGSIFSFLPVAKWEELCVPYFTTPHGYKFQEFAKGFGLNYFAATSLQDFVDHYQQALGDKTSTVIECIVDRKEDLLQTKQIQAQISSLLQSLNLW